MAESLRANVQASLSCRCICGQMLQRSPFSRHFDVLACSTCGTQHFQTRPGHAPREFRYDSRGGKYAQNSYILGRELRWSHHQLLLCEWRGRKILEIGCFNGFFLNELRKRGADVYGFDVNDAALNVGRTLFGLQDRLYSSLDELLALGSFDDVVCIDVVEHLDRPGEFLSQIHGSLAPGGRLFVAGPTIERRFFDKSDYPPHHKWRFSRLGLARCLAELGFSIERTEIQYDGLLMLRNFVGKALNGFWKKEFYGDVRVAAPSIQGKVAHTVYGWSSDLGHWLFKSLGVSYCSTILVARRD